LPALVFVLTFISLLLALELFSDSVSLSAFCSGRFGKPLKLAAPQCVASLGVGLDLHGRAPFFENLLALFNVLFKHTKVMQAMCQK
jgi:hypothetical protein